MNREARFIEDENLRFTQFVTYKEWYCHDCGKLVTITNDDNFASRMLTYHWAETEHPRLSVRKSKESGLWVIRMGDLMLMSLHNWETAFFVAYNRHPWTIHQYKEKARRTAAMQ